MSGRTVLITGATGGIGRETARGLAQLGASVYLVGRDEVKTKQVASEIGAAGYYLADLSLLHEVQGLAAQVAAAHPRLDVLLNNAGAIFDPRQETAEGLEQTWALNHLAPFVLTRELLPTLQRTPGARVITVASMAHVPGRMHWNDPQLRHDYDPWRAYNQSKLANVLFTRELARREPWLRAGSLHPGVVGSSFNTNNNTPMSRGWRLLQPLMLTPQQGAQTPIWLASTPEDWSNGGYFSGRRETQPAPHAQDPAAARLLWDISQDMVEGILGQ